MSSCQSTELLKLACSRASTAFDESGAVAAVLCAAIESDDGQLTANDRNAADAARADLIEFRSSAKSGALVAVAFIQGLVDPSPVAGDRSELSELVAQRIQQSIADEADVMEISSAVPDDVYSDGEGAASYLH